MKIELFDFDLDESLIAQSPSDKRENSRLLLVDKKNKTIFTYEGDGVRVTAEYTYYKNGVILRKDTLKNLTGKKMYLRKFFSRFT